MTQSHKQCSYVSRARTHERMPPLELNVDEPVRVRCTKCGYEFETKAKKPQCTDPEGICNRTRHLERIDESDTDAQREGETDDEDVGNEPVGTAGDSDGDDADTEPDAGNEGTSQSDDVPTDNEDETSDDDMTPEEYQAFQEGESTKESNTDDSADGDSGGSMFSGLLGGFGFDPKIIAVVVLLIVVVFIFVKMQRSGNDSANEPEPEPTSEPEPEPEPEPEDDEDDEDDVTGPEDVTLFESNRYGKDP